MSDKGAVPRLRFSEFDGDWEVSRLGQFFEEYREKSTIQDQHEVLTSARAGLIRQKEYYDNERITERDNVGFNVIPPNFLTYRSRSDNRKFYFNNNTLGITGIISVYYPVFRVIGGSNRFFIEVFSRYIDYLGKFSVGTSQTVLSLNELKRIRLPLPTLPEQEKIADFLGAVDTRVQLLERRRDALTLYKKGIMQRLFVQALRFTREDGTAFPDWQEKRLGDVFCERSERTVNEAELLSVTMHDGIKRLSDLDRTDNSSADKSNYKTVRVGDIAYNSMRMWQGASGLSPYNGIVSPAYTVVRCLQSNVPLFWAYYFKFPDLVHLFQRHSQGLTSDTWNLKFPALATIKASVPKDPEEQQKIADFLSALDRKVDVVARQIDAMQAFKKALLQQMFV